MTMRVADYVARFLVERGVHDIFMLTGNGAMYLNDAILQANIKYYCVRHEATAPIMAESYARLRGSLGAVCLTSGPGSTNALPGLAEAWVESAPILILSGQVQRTHSTHNLKIPVRSFGTAEINIVPIVRPMTKYAAIVNDPSEIRYHLEKAAYLATEGRPGPVWLDIPMDVQYASIEPCRLEGFVPPQTPHCKIADDTLDRVIDVLMSAKRPLVVGGHGLRIGDARSELLSLLEDLRAPIIFSRLGQDLLPFSHPQNLGQAGLKGSRYSARVMKSADVILSLGCRLAVQFVGHHFDAFAPDARVVMVDIEEGELRKPGVPLEVPVLADVKTFIRRLRARLAARELPNWQDWLRACQELKAGNPMVLPEMRRNPIDLYYMMSRLDALAGPRHVFVTDTGSNYYIGGQVYRFEHGQREITSATFLGMGLGIPLAIGASIADPKAQILALTGDGSLEPNIQELKTMSHYKLNIKLFVINNGGYVSMRNWQDDYFDGRRIDTAEKTGVGTLNLEKIAAAFDLRYARIDRYEEIDDGLRNAMADERPVFVEVVCDDKQRIVESMRDAGETMEPVVTAETAWLETL